MFSRMSVSTVLSPQAAHETGNQGCACGRFIGSICTPGNIMGPNRDQPSSRLVGNIWSFGPNSGKDMGLNGNIMGPVTFHKIGKVGASSF